MKNYIIYLIIFSILFTGCGSSDETIDTLANKSVVDKRTAQSYALHQQSIDKEVNDFIDAKISEYTKKFTTEIATAANLYGYIPSEEEKSLILESLLFNFKTALKNELVQDIKGNLYQKYKDTLEGLNLHSSIDLALDDSEKELIKDISYNYFSTQPFSSSKMDVVADSMVSQHLNSPSLLVSENNSSKHSTFESAKSTAQFNKLMGNLFGSYKAEKGDSIGGAIDGGSLHGDNRITNELEDGILTIHEPLFVNGKITVKDTIKKIDLNETVELSTSADINGDGFESLIVESCKNSTLYFNEIASKVNNYTTKLIFTLPNQKCETVTDFVSGDFDGDKRDELALGTNSGVIIFDDADNNFTKMTNFTQTTGYDKDNVYRLASGNVAGKSYDDLGVVVYNSHEKSTFKAKVYLFEMSGMRYLEENNVTYDYTLYTLNKQTLDYTTPADVVVGDFEVFGRLKMYILQITDKEKSEIFGPDEWKERHDQYGIGTELDNHWCSYYGYFKNYLALWSVDKSPLDPINYAADTINKVGEIAITNRISNTYVKPFFGCKDKVENVTTYSYGILFSIKNPIQATAYKKDTSKKNELSTIDLNGIPISLKIFEIGDDYEVSGLFSKESYSAASYDSIKPNLDKTDYQYLKLNHNDYNYINTHIDKAKHESYFAKNSLDPIPSKSYGNRDSNSLSKQRFIFSDGNNIQKIINHPTYYNDSLVMIYKAHNIYYSDPQPIIYMSAPPVKAGQTTLFTYSNGTCEITQKKEFSSFGFTGGVGVLAGTTVGASVLGAEASMEELVGVSAQFQWSKENSEFNASSDCSTINSTVKSDYSNDTNLSSNDLVKVESSIIDSYTYEVIQDLNNSDNIGKDIIINVTRKDKQGEKISYYKWMNISDYLQLLKDNNATAYVDFSSLITHKSGKLDSYNTLDEYNTLQRNKHNTNDTEVIYGNFSKTLPCSVQQDKYSSVDSYQYSLTSTNGTTKGDSDSQTVSIQSLIIFRGGFIIGSSGRVTLNAGWTHKHTITYSSSTSEKFSYKFSALGATTQEPTNGSYRYGAFTYYVRKKDSDGNVKGKPIKIIDFYIRSN